MPLRGVSTAGVGAVPAVPALRGEGLGAKSLLALLAQGMHGARGRYGDGLGSVGGQIGRLRDTVGSSAWWSQPWRSQNHGGPGPWGAGSPVPGGAVGCPHTRAICPQPCWRHPQGFRHSSAPSWGWRQWRWGTFVPLQSTRGTLAPCWGSCGPIAPTAGDGQGRGWGLRTRPGAEQSPHRAWPSGCIFLARRLTLLHETPGEVVT